MAERSISVGFVLAHEQFPVPELLELGVLAEEAGFDSVWASDHFHPWQHKQGHAGHAWMTLAALSQRTSRVRLGTAVTCPTYRFNPANVAHAFATLATLAPGRVRLGVGSGEALNEVPSGGGWGPYAERAARLREAVGLIRRLWTEDWVTMEGEYYHLERANLYDKPPRPIPIYVAGGAPKSLELAATVGDGLITDVGALLDPDRETVTARYFDTWRKDEPDRADPPVIVEVFTVVGDRADAIEGARYWQFLPMSQKVLGEPDPRVIQSRVEAECPPERTADRLLASTDPAEHVAQLERLRKAGATEVFVHAPGPDQRGFIEFYKDHVLPNL